MGTHPIFESDFDCLTEKMASGDAAVAAPTVWAMRTDKVYIEFQVDDAKNVQVAFEDQKITFSCERIEILPDGKKSNQVKNYRNEIDLFGKLDVEKCGYQLFGRCVKCLLPRAEIGEYWPRLTKEKQRIHWLKVDFVRWRDEDDDEGEDKLEQDFDMNKMLGQLRVGEDGKTKDIEDFDDLDDQDSDDEDIDI